MLGWVRVFLALEQNYADRVDQGWIKLRDTVENSLMAAILRSVYIWEC